MSEHRIWPYLCVLFIGVIWGATFSLARLATEDGAHPLGLTFWQAAGGGLVLLTICAATGHWPPITKRFLGVYIIIGSIGSVIPAAIYFYAAPHVPAGILAITIAFVPLLTYAVSWCLQLERFSTARMLGVVLGLTAVFVLVIPDTSLPERTSTGWILMALAATLFYTAENVYVDLYIPKQTNMLSMLAGALVVATILVSPVVIYQDAFIPITGAWNTTELAIIAIALISSIAYSTYLYVIQKSGPVFASQTGYVITLSGIFWGMLIFNESHSIWVWMALALTMIGLLLVTPRKQLNVQRHQ